MIVLARLKIGEFIIGELKELGDKIENPVAIAFLEEGWGLTDYWYGMAKKNKPVPLEDVINWTEPIEKIKEAYEKKISDTKLVVPKNRLINLKDVRKK